jgi:hypothetical protein
VLTTRQSNRESVRENPIMARHHRMPPEEAGYTYAAYDPKRTPSIYCLTPSLAMITIDLSNCMSLLDMPHLVNRPLNYLDRKFKELNRFMFTTHYDFTNGL